MEYVNLPATKDTHHSTAATAVTIAPAAITIAPSTLSPSVSATVAAPDRPTVTSDVRDYPDTPHTSISTPQLPTFMAPQAEILGDPEGCEDVLAATTASGAGLGIPKSRAKASRGRKKKSLTVNDSTTICRSSRHTATT